MNYIASYILTFPKEMSEGDLRCRCNKILFSNKLEISKLFQVKIKVTKTWNKLKQTFRQRLTLLLTP